MNFRDSNQESGEGKYVTKRVMLNGQWVTLYSLNGQTWLSSPEDIPALMERLENARITLNVGEKGPEGEGPGNVAKPEASEEDKGAVKKAVPAKYRMNGPKPRPILRQGGVVIQGTPIDPISASNATMSFSSDVRQESDSSPRRGVEGKGAQKGKVAKTKPGLPHKKMIAPVLARPAGAKAPVSKSAQLAKAIKGAKAPAAKQPAPTKQAPAVKAPVKAVSKIAKKGAGASAKAAPPTSGKKAQPKKKPAPVKKTAAAKKPIKKARASKK